LAQGVYLTLGRTTDQNIQIDLKANSNLSFGDMNIIQDADNVDSFQSMKNLYDALVFNVDKQGVGAPSAWRDEELNSTANPYTAGDFSGNYNDLWNYETLYSGDKNSFYVQKAFKASSGNLKDISSGLNLNFQVTFSDEDNFNTYVINGNYNSWDDVVNDLKTQILNDYPEASISVEDNHLEINSNSGITEVSLKSLDDNSTDLLGILTPQELTDLGFTANSEIVAGYDNVSYNLTNKTIEERTLTFTYNDGTSVIDPPVSITIPADNYDSAEELNNAIQAELDNLFGPNNVNSGILDNKLYFSVENSTSTISEFHVSGDYEGTLGFYKKGDMAKIKITSNNGDLINEIQVDTANKDYFVSDGVFFGFDAGTLYATDSFTTTVGSGIEYEIPILDKAETQITKALTKVGTNQQRAESVINFHQTFETTNEEIKSGYLMSTSFDQTKAMSDYAIAQQAYQAALSVTAQIMQMSLLDFLK
jgi:flagellin-like hook-associated protein FlgL